MFVLKTGKLFVKTFTLEFNGDLKFHVKHDDE